MCNYVDIDQVDFCSLPEFADKYGDDVQFYYMKNGERKFISFQDAYFLYLCPKYGAMQ